MAFEKRDMSGALFVNEKGADNHPDRKGYVIIGGVEYELAGWLKTGKSGQFLSLSAKPKGERPAARQPASRDTSIDLNDEVPF